MGRQRFNLEARKELFFQEANEIIPESYNYFDSIFFQITDLSKDRSKGLRRRLHALSLIRSMASRYDSPLTAIKEFDKAINDFLRRGGVGVNDLVSILLSFKSEHIENGRGVENLRPRLDYLFDEYRNINKL